MSRLAVFTFDQVCEVYQSTSGFYLARVEWIRVLPAAPHSKIFTFGCTLTGNFCDVGVTHYGCSSSFFFFLHCCTSLIVCHNSCCDWHLLHKACSIKHGSPNSTALSSLLLWGCISWGIFLFLWNKSEMLRCLIYFYLFLPFGTCQYSCSVLNFLALPSHALL